MTIGSRYTVEKNLHKNYLNGIGETPNGSGNGNPISVQYSAYIGAVNTRNKPLFFFVGKVYSAKIYDDGVLVRDLCLVRNSVTNEGAMYNLLGTGGMNSDGTPRDDGLYFNRGTGAFVAGPDKAG